MENTICVLRGERAWLSDQNMNYSIFMRRLTGFSLEEKKKKLARPAGHVRIIDGVLISNYFLLTFSSAVLLDRRHLSDRHGACTVSIQGTVARDF
jgi:hypothetical protein